MASAFGFNFDGASAASSGLGLVGALGSTIGAFGAASVADANADAQNRVRQANNIVRRENQSLAQYVQDLNNRRRAEAASEQLDGVQTRAIRAQDAFRAGRLDAGLRESEQLGAQAAQAAASGTYGGSVDAVRSTLQLRNARLQEVAESGQEQSQYEFVRQQAGIVERGITSADLRPITAGYDFNVAQGDTSNIFTNLTESLVSNLLKTPEQRATLNTFLGSIQREAPAAAYTPTSGALGTGTYGLADDFFNYPGSTTTL